MLTLVCSSDLDPLYLCGYHRREPFLHAAHLHPRNPGGIWTEPQVHAEKGNRNFYFDYHRALYYELSDDEILACIQYDLTGQGS